MTLLIYYAILYHGHAGLNWYVLGFAVWCGHLSFHYMDSDAFANKTVKRMLKVAKDHRNGKGR